MPDLGNLYDRAAQHPYPDRNPVIVIPGILGSRLVHEPDGQIVWGAFTPAAVDPRRADEARKLALPMRLDATLAELTDETRHDGALDRIEIEYAKIPLKLDAYANILGTLGAGGYRDSALGHAGAIDYGTDHYSCFQFAYDWRRDNVENAGRLKTFIEEKRVEVQGKHAERFGGQPGDYDVRFDIVAHSMGGLITRYMLRYGDAEPPEVFPDGTVAEPVVTWAGAEFVDQAILVGTPNAGSVASLRQLYQGAEFAPLFPSYPAALLGTMPSVYQLLPRGRHGAVLDAADEQGRRKPVDPLDISFWQQRQWGLADPKQDRVLQMLLPDADNPTERRIIALDHLSKSLARAKAFQTALDAPAKLPPGLNLYLFAGDAESTEAIVETDRDAGTLVPIQYVPGDGTVPRSSAVLDERTGSADADPWSPRLRTPIDWTHIMFLHDDHLGLTMSTTFSDNVLFLLLEKPNRSKPASD
ncbi:MAG: hypothetical protein AAF328_10670 [Planctomycetota bacterium]